MQVHVVHGAVLQEHGGTTVDAGEVVLIALGGGKEGLPTREVAATDQSALLQLAQVPIDGGQSHRLGCLTQQGMEILAGEFAVGLAELRQQLLLAIA